MPEQYMSPNRRQFLAGGLALGAMSALAGCHSTESSGGGASKSPSRGGTLDLVQTADILPKTLLGQNNPNFALSRTVFNTLTEYDHKTLTPKPALARGWEIKDGGKVYVLHLRDDVTFHDGRPFGPEDVVAVINLVKQDTTVSQLKPVAKLCHAAKTGSHEVTLRFSKAVNNVFDLFEMMVMLDTKSYSDLEKGKTFNGTGPFKVVGYRPGSGFSLTKNTAYWKKGRPFLDGVEMSIVSQSTSAVAALQSGQAQLALDLTPLDAASIRNSSGFHTDLVISDANDSVYYLGQNVTVPPLNKPEVRRALAYAVNRDRILSQVLGGIGHTSSLPWAKSSPAYDATKRDTYTYDPEKAKAMLRAAGATGASLGLYYNSGFAPNSGIAQIVQYDLEHVGLHVSAKPMQAAQFQTMLTGSGVPGLFVAPHGFGQIHPATLIKGAFPFNAAANAEKFQNAQYRRLAESMWTTTDTAAAKRLYRQLNELLLEQQFVTDLVASSHTYAISKRLHGLAWTMLDYINLDDAYLTS